MDFENINRFIKKYKYHIIIALILFLVILYTLFKRSVKPVVTPVSTSTATASVTPPSVTPPSVTPPTVTPPTVTPPSVNSETTSNQICKCNTSDPSQTPTSLPCSKDCLKSCNCPFLGEGFIFSFQTSQFPTSLNITSPMSGDLSTMPSGMSLLGSNDGGNTWSILSNINSIQWTIGPNIFRLQNISKPYSLFAVIITSLSQSNYGLVGQIQLMINNSPITLSSTSYDTIKSGNYILYPGFQFNKIATNNFSISYTNMISTPTGSISTDNIKNLIFSDLPSGSFGILPTNTTYVNGKPTQSCPTFQINWW
jgi:hypothetical protein